MEFFTCGNNVLSQLRDFEERFPKISGLIIGTVNDALNESSRNVTYENSTLQDREDLAEILSGMTVTLGGLPELFESWDTGRRDLVYLLTLKATELDIQKENHNKKMAIINGVAAVWVFAYPPAAAISAPVSAIVNMFTAMDNRRVTHSIHDLIELNVAKDTKLTGDLEQELNNLLDYVGRFGKWVQSRNSQSQERLTGDADMVIQHAVCQLLGLGVLANAPLIGETAKRVVDAFASAGRVAELVGAGAAYIPPVVSVFTAASYTEKWLSGEKSEVAENYRKVAELIGKEKDAMEKVYNKIKEESKSQQLQKELEGKDQQLENKDQQLEDKTQQLEDKEQQLEDKEQQIAGLQADLAKLRV